MRPFKNGIDSNDNSIQNRFTAYLKTSIYHRKTKYLAGQYERKNRELSYDDRFMLLALMDDAYEDTYFTDEIGDEKLCCALKKLKERERMIVFRRAVAGESFVKIAADMGLKYVSTKAIYRRSLEKIRKEMLKK